MGFIKTPSEGVSSKQVSKVETEILNRYKGKYISILHNSEGTPLWSKGLLKEVFDDSILLIWNNQEQVYLSSTILQVRERGRE